MTTVVKHALRVGAGMFASMRPEGWHPRLKVVLRGPSPAGAQLVLTATRPDGAEWFSHGVDVPELGEGELTQVDVQRWEDGVDIDEAGTVAFTLRLVSELDAVDELLHQGTMTVVALDGEHRYAVDGDWMLTMGLVCLDTVSDADGPPLKVTAFLKGVVDAYQVEAHLFRDGTRLAEASAVSSGSSFTANDGQPIGTEIVAEFDTVRGWNNLRDQSWGGADWHYLDLADGAYEIKLLRDKRLNRIVAFDVAGGRIVATGAVEGDQWTGPVIVVDATIEGDQDGALGGEGAPFYGDAATAASWLTVDDVYAACRTASPDGSSPDDTSDDPVAHTTTPGEPVTLDETGQAYFDRMERLIMTWASYLEGRTPPYSQDDLLQAEALIRELPGFEEKRSAAAATPADAAVQLNGEDTTIGAMAARVVTMGESAQAMLTGDAAAAEDELAPYRAVLAGDKLAVFEDHSPPSDYVYYTSNRAVIETPEELAAAEFWFFEGPTETDAKATVDGVDVDVKVQGWRVLGWQFDGDGSTLAEWETTGTGADAPKSAYAPKE